MSNLLHSVRKRLMRLRSFPVLGRHEGAKFVLDPQNWTDNRVLARVPYEKAQFDHARQEIAARDLDLVIDIGANFGLYAIVLGLEPNVREVIAFEPVKRNYNQLLANVFANRLDDKVTAHRLALSDKKISGQTIYMDPKSTNLARFDVETADRPADVFQKSEKIDVARFDDILALEGRRAFVKIDVEGEAERCLMGMENFFAKNKGVVQIEVSDCEPGVLSIMERYGWKLLRVIHLDHQFGKD
ncbi:MAG: FkbM family methyltransferase [Micropepsaceae bacterium]